MTIKERFNEFIMENYWTKVDPTHPLELYIGLNERGQQSFDFRGKFEHKKIQGTNAISVTQYAKPEYKTLRFSLQDNEVSGMFYVFCEDLIEATKNSKQDSGYVDIVNHFFKWKKLFMVSKKNLLTEPKIMGLIGEIWFLTNDLSKRIGFPKALESWSGQELTHKDFTYQDTWFEIKTINASSPLVHISSIEQLASDNNGELCVVSLERMSEKYNGISLNKIILETAKAISVEDERNLFLSKVSMQSYEYNDKYDDYVYEKKDYYRYLITKDFPKLTKLNIPSEIIKATYDIALSKIEAFRIKGENK